MPFGPGIYKSSRVFPALARRQPSELCLELRDKVDLVAGGDDAGFDGEVDAVHRYQYDVLSALINLGCQRPAAETAIRKAVAGGAPATFEPLFRKALELVR